MKKSFVAAAGTAIAAAVLVVGAVSASVNPWSQFTKSEGPVDRKEGVVYQPPSNRDKADLVKSIDPVTDKPTHRLQNKAEGLVTKTIRMNHDGYSVDLEFDYVSRNGMIVLLPRSSHKPGAGYSAIVPLPNTNKSVIEFEGSLYVVDVEHDTIDKLLKDQVGGYSIEEAKAKSKQPSASGGDSFVWWGHRPSINPSGTILVFGTTRSGRDEVWVKDLASGEEKAFIQGAINPVGWVNDQEFVASSFGHLQKIHVGNGNSESLGDMNPFAVSSPYLVGQQSGGAVEFVDLSTGDSRTLKHESLVRVSGIAISVQNLSVAILCLPNPQTPKHELLVVNMKDLTTKRLDVPEGKVGHTMHWQDDQTLLLTLSDLQTRDEETIVVEIEKL